MCKPVIIDEDWKLQKICTLTEHHVITLLGRELHVQYSVPSEKGGDFYVLEAYGTVVDSRTAHYQDVVSFTLDKNQEVYARLAEGTPTCANHSMK